MKPLVIIGITTSEAAGTCLALIVGACLGWLSEYTAGLLTTAKRDQAPVPIAETQPVA